MQIEVTVWPHQRFRSAPWSSSTRQN